LRFVACVITQNIIVYRSPNTKIILFLKRYTKLSH